MKQPARVYTTTAGIFLLIQGTSTLAFRVFPPLDQAFPALLAVTAMIPPHSILHILTGIVALATLLWGGEHGSVWFAAGFGVFYLSLAFFGIVTHHPTLFGLQLFDHPFHLFLGAMGLLAAGYSVYRSKTSQKASV